MNSKRKAESCAPAQHVATAFYNLELSCTQTGQSKHETLAFPEDSPPSTVAQLKDKIEEDFSIPVCVQSVRYEGHILGDSTSLERMRIRPGDTFHLTYSSTGHCREINGTVTWFALVREGLVAEAPSRTRPISAELRDLVLIGFTDELLDNLAYTYLFPWLDPQKYTNRLYFVQCGGLEVIMDVYASLSRIPWKETLLILKYLENGIIRVLWNMSETFQLRRLIMSHNDGLGMCMESLLRQALEERKAIMDESDPVHGSPVLMDTIEGALGLLCNLSELPECHEPIASNERCLEQLTCISLTPSVNIISVQLVATIFVCMAYTPSTHSSLAKPLLIGRLMEACTGDIVQKSSPVDALMLSYYTQVFLAQVILTSPYHMPSEALEQILRFMEDFLKIATYQSLRNGELKHWYVWATFLPYIKLIYFPEPTQQRSTIMDRLHTLSLQTVLLSLQNMLGRDNHREILLKESLEDYITCMPAYLPVGPLRDQAKELVQVVRGGACQLQPPSLINLVKAKLAKMHFGLVRVVNMGVGELISEVFPA